MIYSAIDQAFNNNNNNNIQGFNNNDLLNYFETGDDYDNYRNIMPKIYTAQGNYESYDGTKLCDLMNSTTSAGNGDDLSAFSFGGLSDFISDVKSEKKNEKQSEKKIIAKDEKNNIININHAFCIDFIINEIYDNPINSVKYEDEQCYKIYDHVHKCKYCKETINKTIREQFSTKAPPVVHSQNIQNIIETFDDNINNGYDTTEIIIIIIACVLLILILDFCVKLGKRIK